MNKDLVAHNQQLCRDEVRLWWSALDGSELVDDVFVDEMLSFDERERAARFHFARDRRRFVLARGMVRHILAQYTNTRPQEIRFQDSARGKPQLVDSEIEFNLTHSDELVICAIARGCLVGVDVERVRPLANWEQIAEKMFSPAEQKTLWSLEPNQQLVGFFNCWTRKEAYVKARGDGLVMPLDAFDVSLKPAEPAALLGNRLDADEANRWLLAEISPMEPYIGALAWQGQDGLVQMDKWEW